MIPFAVSRPPALWRIGKLTFTVGLLVLLWSAVDGPEVLKQLVLAKPGWLAAAVSVLMMQTVLSAWRWKITARELGQSFTLQYAIREYFMSQAINQAAPGAVLGDAARAVRAREEVGLGIAGLAVALERFAGQIAMFLTLVCALVVTSLVPGGIDLGATYAGSMLLGLLIVVLAALLVFYFGKTGPVHGPAYWFALAYRGLLSPRVLPAQVLLGVAITACNLAAFGLSTLATGVVLGLPALLTLVPLILFAMLIPLTVSGWGVREGSAALLLPLVGVSVPEAIAASVLFGIALLLAVLPGFFLMATK